MKLAPMQYKDYVWPHNPETYTITFERRVAVKKVPFGRYGMQDLGLTYRVMRGEGEFVGENAYAELELTQQPLEDYVRYRFTFWATSPLDTALIRVSNGSAAAADGAKSPAKSAYSVVRGDTLWGIADRFGVTLTVLLRANPQIKNPNYIVTGQQVVIP